jgi:hypothetical protein
VPVTGRRMHEERNDVGQRRQEIAKESVSLDVN